VVTALGKATPPALPPNQILFFLAAQRKTSEAELIALSPLE